MVKKKLECKYKKENEFITRDDLKHFTIAVIFGFLFLALGFFCLYSLEWAKESCACIADCVCDIPLLITITISAMSFVFFCWGVIVMLCGFNRLYCGDNSEEE